MNDKPNFGSDYLDGYRSRVTGCDLNRNPDSDTEAWAAGYSQAGDDVLAGESRHRAQIILDGMVEGRRHIPDAEDQPPLTILLEDDGIRIPLAVREQPGMTQLDNNVSAVTLNCATQDGFPFSVVIAGRGGSRFTFKRQRKPSPIAGIEKLLSPADFEKAIAAMMTSGSCDCPSCTAVRKAADTFIDPASARLYQSLPCRPTQGAEREQFLKLYREAAAAAASKPTDPTEKKNP